MNHQTEQIIIRDTELGEERWLIIPEGTTKIDEHAYESREDFTHVSIPASVTEIGERAFAGCSKLVEVTLHRELTSLGKFVFSRCTALRMVTLPYTFTEIPNGFFLGCSNLFAVDFCGGSMGDHTSHLQRIGDFAFAACAEYDSAIPDGVEEIGDFAFQGCRSFGRNLLPPALPGVVNLPNALSKMGRYAFMGCTGMEIVNLGGLTSISHGAFVDCRRLVSYIPRQVTEIEDYAFANCTALRQIDFPKTLEKIGNGVYEGCSSLEEAVIPERFRDNVSTMFGNTPPAVIKYQ